MKGNITLNHNNIISRKTGIDTTDLDNDKVMMDLNKGKYYVMNEIASDIWESISQPKTVQDIIKDLMGIYEVDEEECTRCTIEYLIKLHHEELICVN
ncbi:lasso peptide biosynthesis PqqD family chaperone [Clostridium thermarum]|uniref:lasso peptide biosynthesis PqqD family chaperone n=1 Tax=Clostridium thermarum TaxID=1716543 RepID=UPI001121CF06|nr:lasso peptide biosynthesis PqqD family chaperone [Clostridium thermarum]